MAANVENVLELGLREAAETVWARKLVVEVFAARVRDIFLEVNPLLDAARAHAQAIGRAEGFAFALELIRLPDEVITAERIFGDALRQIGDQVWDRTRIEAGGLGLGPVLGFVEADLSWADATIAAATAARHHAPRPL